MPDDMEQEADAVELEPDAVGVENTMRLGRPAGLTCPECHGALWELQEESGLLRFRCHVGHAFTADTLLAEQGKELEAALWMALCALEENAMLSRRLAHRAHKHGSGRSATRFEEQARGIEARAEVIRRVLRTGSLATIPESARVNPSASGLAPADVGLEAAG